MYGIYSILIDPMAEIKFLVKINEMCWCCYTCYVGMVFAQG